MSIVGFFFQLTTGDACPCSLGCEVINKRSLHLFWYQKYKYIWNGIHTEWRICLRVYEVQYVWKTTWKNNHKLGKYSKLVNQISSMCLTNANLIEIDPIAVNIYLTDIRFGSTGAYISAVWYDPTFKHKFMRAGA